MYRPPHDMVCTALENVIPESERGSRKVEIGSHDSERGMFKSRSYVTLLASNYLSAFPASDKIHGTLR
jgi:hypothetical protein